MGNQSKNYSEGRKRAKERLAGEVLAFRQKYLFRQTDLATALQCSRRTIQGIEAAQVLPQMDLRRRFVEFKREFAKRKDLAA
jgi:DNA-binding XRE family transcriptional regulator